MINVVLADRIMELTEPKTKFQKIKKMASNWKTVVICSVLFLTAKVAAEQLAMMILRHQ